MAFDNTNFATYGRCGRRNGSSARTDRAIYIGFRSVNGVLRGGRSGIASNSQRCGFKLANYSRGTVISSFGFRLCEWCIKRWGK